MVNLWCSASDRIRVPARPAPPGIMPSKVQFFWFRIEDLLILLIPAEEICVALHKL
jgi:hypothetical protein